MKASGFEVKLDRFMNLEATRRGNLKPPDSLPTAIKGGPTGALANATAEANRQTLSDINELLQWRARQQP